MLLKSMVVSAQYSLLSFGLSVIVFVILRLFFYYPHFRYNATFIDLPVARFSPGKMIHETQVVDAMRGLLENLKQQARTNMSMEDLKDSEPDLK